MACYGRKSEYEVGKTYINGDKTKKSSQAPRGAKLKCVGFYPCPHGLRTKGKCKGYVLLEGSIRPACVTWNGVILPLKKEQPEEIKKETIEDRVLRITQLIEKEVNTI